MSIRDNLAAIKKLFSEPVFFYGLILVNIIPLLVFKYFPTMDGPAHLYNANLIKDLIFNSDSQLGQYFSANPKILNYLHHVILVPLLCVFPSFLAEKILLIIYIASLSLAFRYLVITIKPENAGLSYLVFPFIYTFLFILGFYNYSLSIILMFLILAFFYKTKDNLNITKIAILFILMSFLYFGHLFVFMTTCLAIGFVLLSDNIFQIIQNQHIRANDVKSLLLNISKLLVICSFGIIKVFLFLFQKTNGGNIENTESSPFSQLLTHFINIRPIIAYNFTGESGFSTILFLVLFTSSVIILYRRLGKSVKLEKIDVFLLLSLLFLIIYLISPNYIPGIGGHFSVRIGIPLFLFFILWMALQDVSRTMNNVLVTTSIVINLLLLNQHAHNLNSLNNDAKTIEQAADSIEPYGVVLPIDASSHWMQNHFSNYLGMKKPLIILENYEVSSCSFPLVWNWEQIPSLKLGHGINSEFCIKWPLSGSKQSKTIEYIFVWGTNYQNVACYSKLDSIIKKSYIQVYTSEAGNAVLYKLNK